MPALTATEAQARAALITVVSYDVVIDFTATPVRSRTEVRFRCRRPGSASFADLTATVTGGGAELNGVPLPPPADGRLTLPGLAAENVLTVAAEIPDRGLAWFDEPSGCARYVRGYAYPTAAPDLFCCFDQLDLPAPLALSVRVPAGWSCLANGQAAERPAEGGAGTWRFAPIRLKPLEFTVCAGPLRVITASPAASPAAAAAPVAVTAYGRAGLAGPMAGFLTRFTEIAAGALRRYERELGVACPSREVEIIALPDVPFRAASVPGLLLVSEDLLARLADPDDDFAAMIAAHEAAHLWFGALVGMRWWDDLWLEESLATYLSEWTEAGWTAFSYDEKPRALRADQLPATEPVSSPVATMAQARDRPNAISYVKGTAAVRQLAALIGPDAVTRGLADYLTRFADVGSARLDDLVGCWSRAAGRDLAGWADVWLRTTGTPTLAATVTEGPDGSIAAVTVTQDLPRPHRVGVALYDVADGGRLRHRRTEWAELAGAATELTRLAGDPPPAAVFPNAGDRALAHVAIDDRSLAALVAAAFDVGDPLTEAACWNAAWHLVLTGRLRPADYAALVARRLNRADPAPDPAPDPALPPHTTAFGRAPSGGDPVPHPDAPNDQPDRPAAPAASLDGGLDLTARSDGSDTAACLRVLADGSGSAVGQAPHRADPVVSPVTPTAARALLARALTCADRYVPEGDRPAVRAAIADAALAAAIAPAGAANAPLARALLAGFAATAQTDAQLATVRALLDGDLATIRVESVDLTLRAALVRALAIRDLATPADLDALVAADPVAGRALRVGCAAARPDPAAKEAAWAGALDERAPQWLARANAEGFWVPGQEPVLTGYRDRYFTEALPALSARDARGERLARRLAELLFPVTLDPAATLAAVPAALARDGLTGRLRAVLRNQEAELRTAADLSRA